MLFVLYHENFLSFYHRTALGQETKRKVSFSPIDSCVAMKLTELLPYKLVCFSKRCLTCVIAAIKVTLVR